MVTPRVWQVVRWGFAAVMIALAVDGLLTDVFPAAGCTLGRAAACVESGLEAYGAKPPRYDTALADWRKACDGGEVLGCQNLGVLFEHGRGVKRDAHEASVLYDQACQNESWIACRNLANLLVKGDGVPQDRGRARKLFELACAKGNALACNDVGWRFEDIPPAERARYYRRACEGGAGDGCDNWGTMLARGTGIAADQQEAKRVLNEGCVVQERGAACLALAELHEEGVFGVADRARVTKLYTRACELEEARGCSKAGVLDQANRAARFERALELLRRGCREGEAEDCADEVVIGLAAGKLPIGEARALLAGVCARHPSDRCRDHLQKLGYALEPEFGLLPMTAPPP